jgi:hypothetical protein
LLLNAAWLIHKQVSVLQSQDCQQEKKSNSSGKKKFPTLSLYYGQK